MRFTFVVLCLVATFTGQSEVRSPYLSIGSGLWHTVAPSDTTLTDALLDRLVSLSTLHTAVYYFHPQVSANPSARTSWDSAVATTISTLVSAPRQPFARVVVDLLATLGDPGTGLEGIARALPWSGRHETRQYRGHEPEVSNPYGGGYKPFHTGWEELPSTGHLRQSRLELSDDVVVFVRTSRPLEPAADSAAKAEAGEPALNSSYPGPGHRVIAAYRAHSVVRLFFPYADLIPDDWNDVMRSAIPALLGARDSVEYAMAVSAMVKHFHDSHVSVTGGAMDVTLDGPRPEVAVRVVDGHAVVTDFTSDSVRFNAGLTRGDVIVSIDGEPVEERMARLSHYLPASTPQGMRDLQAVYLLHPVPGRPTVHVRARKSSGEVIESELRVSDRWWVARRDRRAEPVFRIVDQGIGYIDLTRLLPAQVDSAFHALRDTRAIIFDLRGYPRGTAWSIAPRLVRANSEPVAYAWTNVVSSPIDAPQVRGEMTPVPTAAEAEPYHGRTVILIDERAVSQAEYTAMMFRAANNTIVVGSPSMGANGDVTDFAVPGGLRVSFSGNGSRFPDGRQLQRRGIQPDIYATVTLDGIRNGRDEVLEAALRFLRQHPDMP